MRENTILLFIHNLHIYAHTHAHKHMHTWIQTWLHMYACMCGHNRYVLFCWIVFIKRTKWRKYRCQIKFIRGQWHWHQVDSILSRGRRQRRKKRRILIHWMKNSNTHKCKISMVIHRYKWFSTKVKYKIKIHGWQLIEINSAGQRSVMENNDAKTKWMSKAT